MGLSSSGVGGRKSRAPQSRDSKSSARPEGRHDHTVDREALVSLLDMADKPGHHGSSSTAGVINPAATEAGNEQPHRLSVVLVSLARRMLSKI